MPQPSAADLNQLAHQGIRTVVNLRHTGENAKPLSIESEGDLVKRLGMDYVHLPVSMKTATAQLATAFETLLAAAREDGPVVIHCKLGQRASAMVLIAAARHLGWNAPQALSQADRLGLGDITTVPSLNTYVHTCLGGKCKGTEGETDSR